MHQADLRRASSVLRIDLGAICENYRALRARVRGSCGAVVKADMLGAQGGSSRPGAPCRGAPGFFGADLMRLFSSIGEGLP
jgi:alanine racemase